MSFFQDLYAQGRAAFLAMPMPSRVIGGGLVLVIAIGMALLVRTGTSSGGMYLFGGRLMSDEEIRKAEGAFSADELRDYDIVGNRIRVPAKSKDRYLRALVTADALPSDLDTATERALSEISALESKHRTDQRLLHARQQDVGQAIMRFPDVKVASVTYDHLRQGFIGDYKQSASVVVTPRGNAPLSPQLRKMIQNMVAKSWAGLDVENVLVTDTNAGAGGNSSWADIEDLNPYLAAKLRYREAWEQQIRNVLEPYGNIRLGINVELDPKLDVNSTQLQYQEPMTLEESLSQYESESNRTADGGVPGVASNAYSSNKPTSIAQERSQTNKVTQSSERARREAGQEYTQSRTAGLVPQRVGVSVGIPSSYYRQVFARRWLDENPEQAADEVPKMTKADREQLINETETQIQTAVATLLPPVPAGDDRLALVEVYDYADLPESPLPKPSVAENALAWLAESWMTLALFATALAALLVARSVVRSSPTGPEPEFAEGFGLEIPDIPQDELALSEDAEKRGGKQIELTGGSLRDDLLNMVDSNPDAAANVLRAWIGEPAA